MFPQRVEVSHRSQNLVLAQAQGVEPALLIEDGVELLLLDCRLFPQPAEPVAITRFSGIADLGAEALDLAEHRLALAFDTLGLVLLVPLGLLEDFPLECRIASDVADPLKDKVLDLGGGQRGRGAGIPSLLRRLRVHVVAVELSALLGKAVAKGKSVLRVEQQPFGQRPVAVANSSSAVLVVAVKNGSDFGESLLVQDGIVLAVEDQFSSLHLAHVERVGEDIVDAGLVEGQSAFPFPAPVDLQLIVLADVVAEDRVASGPLAFPACGDHLVAGSLGDDLALKLDEGEQDAQRHRAVRDACKVALGRLAFELRDIMVPILERKIRRLEQEHQDALATEAKQRVAEKERGTIFQRQVNGPVESLQRAITSTKDSIKDLNELRVDRTPGGVGSESRITSNSDFLFTS